MRTLKPAILAFLLEWLPVVLWAALIFAFSAQSNLRFAQALSRHIQFHQTSMYWVLYKSGISAMV